VNEHVQANSSSRNLLALSIVNHVKYIGGSPIVSAPVPWDRDSRDPLRWKRYPAVAAFEW
jgi:hypothetical protein